MSNVSSHNTSKYQRQVPVKSSDEREKQVLRMEEVRRASGTCEVLWRCCGGVVEVLWRCCGGVVEVLWRCCEGVVEVLWRCCGGAVKVYCKGCESFL